MEIRQVAEVLDNFELGVPTLDALVPNQATYSVLLFQPQGNILANNSGVRNKDTSLADKQFGAFLAEAKHSQADLALTPEYSMPWKTLVNAIKTATMPAPGKLWVLGCESIRFQELEDLRKELTGYATVICEALQAATEDKFVDPLAYVFFAPKNGFPECSQLVILIQFKTFPMGDLDNFEVNRLHTGSLIYRFANNGPSVSLVSLICSDALDFSDTVAGEIYDRALIIHIQLNPSPRHQEFIDCRGKLLKYHGDETEVLCLNWASEVNCWLDDKPQPWKNVAASAWYLKSSAVDIRDENLCANHRRGLYYTWLKSRRTHALFFNYDAALYFLNTTKVVHIGVTAPASRRRGPMLSKT